MLHAVRQIGHNQMDALLFAHGVQPGPIERRERQRMLIARLEMLGRIGKFKDAKPRRLLTVLRERFFGRSMLDFVIFEIALEILFSLVDGSRIAIRAQGVIAAIDGSEERRTAPAHGIGQRQRVVRRKIRRAQRQIDEIIGENFVGLALVFEHGGQIVAQIGGGMSLKRHERAVFHTFKEQIEMRRSANERRLLFVKARAFKCQPVRAGHRLGAHIGLNAALFEQQRQFGRGQLQRFGLIAAVGVGPQ